jgi:excisionase family DNA binding protein
VKTSTAPLPRLAYTADEVAEMLGVGRSTAYEWARLGRVESIRIGGVLRITAAGLHDLLERHRVKPAIHN